MCIASWATAQVDVYRWVDDNGVVHFSDTRRDAGDEHIQLQTIEPSDEALAAHSRLIDQQLELIALLEQSRQSRAQESLERQRQNVELARARLALEQERNAALGVYEDSGASGGWGYAYPVQYSWRFHRRHGQRRWSGRGYGTGYPPARLPSRPGLRPGGPGHGGGHGQQTISKPFITSR